MSQQLISRSPDLLRLQEEGYEVRVIGAHLIIENVPYVDDAGIVRRGRLLSTLAINDGRTARPDTHVAYFAGSVPCDANARQLVRIVLSSARQALGDDIFADHMLSSKPAIGHYADYHEKMTTYVAIIANEASAIDTEMTARTHRVVANDDVTSPFQYLDTASSRAGIGAVSDKLAGERIAIIGMGGTGSYVLDQVAKTPAERIDIVDPDDFLQHNAFRAPGAPSLDCLRERLTKVEHFSRIYSGMHRGIVPHPVRMGPDNLHLLADATFVFLCLDSGEAKAVIIAELERLDLPFVDVGMGLHLVDDCLIGALRVTTSTPGMRDHVRDRQRIPLNGRGVDDVYARNIQVADLNMVNAGLAVMRWKRFRTFYKDFEREHFSIYTVDGNHMINEDRFGEAA